MMGGSGIRRAAIDRPESVLGGLASPGLRTRTVQEIEDDLKDKPWERIQANAFKHWMNHQVFFFFFSLFLLSFFSFLSLALSLFLSSLFLTPPFSFFS